MIPFLVLKHFDQAFLKYGLIRNPFFKIRLHFLPVGLLLVLTSFSPLPADIQNSEAHYKVQFNGENIGWLRLEQNTTGDKLTLALISEIKARFVFPITVFSKEVSTFEKGKLIFSSLYRKTNGSVKLNKQIKRVDDGYEVVDEGEKTKFSSPLINDNLLSLYFKEPKNLSSVYCDKKQCYVKITKTEDGGYQMKFSNGNSNCFYYKEGICTRVKIEHLFYTAEIIISH